MDEHDHHGRTAVEEEAEGLIDEPQVHEGHVDDAGAAQDDLPGVDADEVIDLHGNDEQVNDQGVVAAHHPGQEVGNGIAHEHEDDHHPRDDDEGVPQDAQVGGIAQKGPVILQGKRGLQVHEPGLPETHDEEERHGRVEEEQQVHEGREHVQDQPRVLLDGAPPAFIAVRYGRCCHPAIPFPYSRDTSSMVSSNRSQALRKSSAGMFSAGSHRIHHRPRSWMPTTPLLMSRR